MRHRILAAVLPSAAAFGLAWACNGVHNSTTPPGEDASSDASFDVAEDTDGAVIDTGGPSDATVDPCAVDGADPVALCVQQQVLASELIYAYTKGQGVAPGWSSTGPGYTALTGHSWQDDLGLAGSLGAYYCSSEVYGNNHATAGFNAVLADLGTVLQKEVQATPPPYQGLYDGEIYFRLRWAESAFDYIADPSVTALAAAANAYGTSLAQQAYAVTTAADAGVPGGTVIGTKNGDGSIAYAPAQSIMAAAALLDLASLNATSADGGPVSSLVATAQQVIAYVLARGKDPTTGLFYQSLVTSADPGHDAPGPGTPTSDSMLTATQAWIVLGLARAEDALDALQSVADSGVADGATQDEPYWTAASSLVASMTAATLFDGTATPPAPPAAQPVGAFMEGLVLSSGELLTDKATIDNSILLGGFHRVTTGIGSSQAYELGEVRSALSYIVQGQALTAHENLLSIVTDPAGNVVQQAYLRAGSRSFGYALAYGVDGGPGEADGGGGAEEQGATNYRSDAVHAMVEGFSQLWHGAANDARCAP